LVELLIVVSLIGVLVAMSVPRFPLASLRADAGLRTLRGALQTAQRLAVTRQSNVVVIVDTAEHRLRLHEDTDRDNTVDANERVRTIPLEEGALLSLPPAGLFGAASDVAVGTNLRERDGMPSITFRRDGTSTSDLELYVRASATRQTAWRAVAVAPSTGRVDGFRYVDTTWARTRP
jgi:type II secretory pathway pseudopilin PulG